MITSDGQDLVTAINQARVKNGVKALKVRATLCLQNHFLSICDTNELWPELAINKTAALVSRFWAGEAEL